MIGVLSFWKSLDNNWKSIFIIHIQINLTLLRLKYDLDNSSLTQNEQLMATSNDDFEINDEFTKTLILTYFFLNRKLKIGRKQKFILQDLSPLLWFELLAEIEFYNCKILDCSALKKLKKLKSITFNEVELAIDLFNFFNALQSSILQL